MKHINGTSWHYYLDNPGGKHPTLYHDWTNNRAIPTHNTIRTTARFDRAHIPYSGTPSIITTEDYASTATLGHERRDQSMVAKTIIDPGRATNHDPDEERWLDDFDDWEEWLDELDEDTSPPRDENRCCATQNTSC